MKKNHLNHYVAELLNSTEKNLCVYIRYRKPQSLHLLRVSIKKIKAIFSFAEKTYKMNYNISKLKQLFQKAGKIRDLQINEHLLSMSPKLSDKIFTSLQKRENNLNKQFIQNNQLYNKLIGKFRDNINLPEKLPCIKKIKKYFKKERLKANKLLYEQNRESTHRYRIKIKKIMYLYYALPKRIREKIQMDISEINKQQKKLGNWHDTYAAINFLPQENKDKNLTPVLEILKTKENRQFENLKLKLI